MCLYQLMACRSIPAAVADAPDAWPNGPRNKLRLRSLSIAPNKRAPFFQDSEENLGKVLAVE